MASPTQVPRAFGSQSQHGDQQAASPLRKKVYSDLECRVVPSSPQNNSRRSSIRRI